MLPDMPAGDRWWRRRVASTLFPGLLRKRLRREQATLPEDRPWRKRLKAIEVGIQVALEDRAWRKSAGHGGHGYRQHNAKQLFYAIGGYTAEEVAGREHW